MAIRALNTLVVANYNTAASASFLAGDALMISVTDGTVSAGFRAATGFTTIAQQLGRFVGFSADDTARTGNTMILADPVGSSYTDSTGALVANNNGFYVVSKRAIGDFLAENVNGVTPNGLKVAWSQIAGRSSIDEEAVKAAMGEVPKKQGEPQMRLTIK
jgi:hypothetical protein